MFGGLNPKKMQGMMKKMGISQEEIDANRVVIECPDKNIIIENPQVMKINMQGQESFQISGDVSESSEDDEGVSEDDIKMVMEKTGAEEDKVRETLEKNKGDIASSIMELKS